MQETFVNRERELAELDRAAASGGLLVIFGRRRVGKTRLLSHWLRHHEGLYSQAIEASRDVQIAQVVHDLGQRWTTRVEPKTWSEFFELLALQPSPWTLCLDEFTYLVASDPSLPSRLQQWLDHALPPGSLLILAGSSTRMMNDTFLNRAAPLYGRARKLLHLAPMEYSAFCRACRLDPEDMATFERFACVGGVPKYWEAVDPRLDAVALADDLYFDFAPYMEQEPRRLLADEGVAGLGALAVLEAVGRGAERPSEIATRLGTRQTNLSRLLQQLLDASILTRDLPYGESVRTTKRVLYRIQDPAMRFWFRVFSPHQSLWRSYAPKQKRSLVHEHAASVFEDVCRARVPGARRYWDPQVELDLVAPDPNGQEGLLVAEIKWRRVSKSERTRLLKDLEARWARSALAGRHARVRFEVMDATLLSAPVAPAHPST
jgi:hypothetical protein